MKILKKIYYPKKKDTNDIDKNEIIEYINKIFNNERTSIDEIKAFTFVYKMPLKEYLKKILIIIYY